MTQAKYIVWKGVTRCTFKSLVPLSEVRVIDGLKLSSSFMAMMNSEKGLELMKR